jgi:hypothetical protein
LAVPQLPFNLDIGPCDIFLLARIMTQLRGGQFATLQAFPAEINE